MRYMIMLAALMVAGCLNTVSVERGCSEAADCGADQFCLETWDLAPSGPKEVYQCTARGEEGTLCLKDGWCRQGLACRGPYPSLGGACEAP